MVATALLRGIVLERHVALLNAHSYRMNKMADDGFGPLLDTRRFIFYGIASVTSDHGSVESIVIIDSRKLKKRDEKRSDDVIK
jgi:hypothetical protein